MQPSGVDSTNAGQPTAFDFYRQPLRSVAIVPEDGTLPPAPAPDNAARRGQATSAIFQEASMALASPPALPQRQGNIPTVTQGAFRHDAVRPFGQQPQSFVYVPGAFEIPENQNDQASIVAEPLARATSVETSAIDDEATLAEVAAIQDIPVAHQVDQDLSNIPTTAAIVEEELADDATVEVVSERPASYNHGDTERR